ncbi:MAG: ubiquinone/menaquinone biosynthesis C-methylase UbiE [Pirellulaceae bacterium]|jgi:ubiquinone/menaquinone biosynthesis C-methylase UbiE
MFHPNGPTFFELARQALSSTEHGYDLLASKFDYTPFRTPAFVLEAIHDAIRDGGSTETGLDVCCGTGAGMELLLSIGCKSVTGIDMSAGMLEVAQRNIAELNSAADVSFVRGEVLEMPFRDEFDLAVCFGAFGHILPKDEMSFVQQIHKSLKVGGRFCFVTTGMPSLFSLQNLFSRSFNAAMHIRNTLLRPPFVMFYLTFLLPQTKEMLEEEGFEVVVDESLFNGPLKPLKFVTATKVQ